MASGPLGAFSVRIRLAHALAWISDDVQFDLNVIRSVRNEFAHNFDHELSFANQSIADKCQNLRTAQVLLDANEHAASTPHPNFSAAVIRAMGASFHSQRQRYEVSVEMLAQHLDDLEGESDGYAGPDFKEELWRLGSSVNVKITATGKMRPPQS
jgi:DNA-binding MltR family transcriptional regulator